MAFKTGDIIEIGTSKSKAAVNSIVLGRKLIIEMGCSELTVGKVEKNRFYINGFTDSLPGYMMKYFRQSTGSCDNYSGVVVGTKIKLVSDVTSFLRSTPLDHGHIIDAMDRDFNLVVKSVKPHGVTLRGCHPVLSNENLKKHFEIVNDAVVVVESLNNDNCEYDGNPESAQKCVAAKLDKLAVMEQSTYSQVKAVNKLLALGYEFSNGDWYNTEELQQQKLAVMVSAVSCMSHDDIAQLLIKHNIEL